METQLSKASKQELVRQTQVNSIELFQAIAEVDISGTRTSVVAVREMGGQPLSSLVRKTETGVDKAECYKFIKLCTVWLCEFFGVSWNDIQVKESSKQLYENYFFWTEYDWKHFMSRVVSGYFGKMFGSFSPAMLMEYAGVHSEEWMKVSENFTKHELDLIGKQEEGVNDFTKMIEDGKQKIRDRFHQENVDKFKGTVEKPDNFKKPE